jgi:hypothetical protein
VLTDGCDEELSSLLKLRDVVFDAPTDEEADEDELQDVAEDLQFGEVTDRVLEVL